MDMAMYAGFFDEFMKIAQETSETSIMSPMEKEKYLKFGLIGATAGPVIAGATNLIRGPKIGDVSKGVMHTLTQGSKLHRWVPAQMAAGALAGAAVPILRRRAEKNVERKYQQMQAPSVPA